ncbi:Thiol-disulfide oxidoreductase ResA [Neolewinella maritima]|uniref:Thiol-disulfide oxidoreductase ResA n=1 Tax=Neolewinella maritima TaxID=1383882 RepID=A0ABM9B1S3_9BACT|nr:thioredoxin family protein [Neolewinella maritima]CAH1000858.1 Thiol-disulfide oxidoreductase ResA [Neolewinella maritima]
MALTESTMVDIGTQAPDFNLLDTLSGFKLSYKEVRGENGTLVLFICNHCPYVIHTIDALVDVANEYEPKGICTVAISSNDVVNYPVDSPDNMEAFALNNLFTFPYLYDETQEVARAYAAACTPDIYLFDANDKLYYRGRLDDSRPNSGKQVTGHDLRAAMDLLLQGKSSPEPQYPSAGCGIKWKK